MCACVDDMDLEIEGAPLWGNRMVCKDTSDLTFPLFGGRKLAAPI